jgi:lipopolysaccharide export system protein LptC
VSSEALARAWAGLRHAGDRLLVYLPVILMGLVALGTYWLARNTPVFSAPAAVRPPSSEPDYFMRRFSVRNFQPDGRLRSEVFGSEGRHFPDSDILEVEEPRIRAFSDRGELTTATARRAVSNGDGTQVQLFGNAVVVRGEGTDAAGRPVPRMEIRSDFLHLFVDTEQLRTDKPVTLLRGNDRFEGDAMVYDHVERVLQLEGRVRGLIQPQAPR